jgi:hypothetical protein
LAADLAQKASEIRIAVLTHFVLLEFFCFESHELMLLSACCLE